MKFLCPDCKAKYKIADEKVAGRDHPRMKCRKCGHVIDILKAVAETAPSVEPSEPAPSPSAAGPAKPRAVPPPRARHNSSVQGRAPKAGGAPAPRPAAGRGLGARPAPRPRPGASASAAVAAAPAPQPSGFEDEDPTVVKDIEGIADIAALAGAFKREVGAETRPSAAPVSLSEEWYLGVDGVPEGPLSRSDIVAKAAAGKATRESLVWKDGFEDWKPLGDFPELVAIVEEAENQPAAPVPAAGAPAPGIAAAPAEPAKEAGTGMDAGLGVGAGAALGAAGGPGVDLGDDLSFPPAGFKKKSSTPAAAWIAVFVALAFGVTIGAVFLSKKEREEVVKYVEVPASAPAAAAGDSPPDEEDEPASSPAEEEAQGSSGENKGASGKGVAAAAAKGSGTSEDKKSGKGGLLAGLNNLQGAGPSSGPKSTKGSSGSGGGGELDGVAVQRTVRKYSQSVRRSCWQPALDTRSKDAPSSARVNVSITVAASGAVQNVSSSGDPRGYHGLARCIQSKVRSWRFPRSSGTTTVNVPFVFAAQ